MSWHRISQEYYHIVLWIYSSLTTSLIRVPGRLQLTLSQLHPHISYSDDAMIWHFLLMLILSQCPKGCMCHYNIVIISYPIIPYHDHTILIAYHGDTIITLMIFFSQCPEGCTCYHDSTWKNNVIDCRCSSHNHHHRNHITISMIMIFIIIIMIIIMMIMIYSSRGHTALPPLIPMDATTLHLDGNNLGNVLLRQVIIIVVFVIIIIIIIIITRLPLWQQQPWRCALQQCPFFFSS